MSSIGKGPAIEVRVLGDDATVAFAAEELAKYLRRVTAKIVEVRKAPWREKSGALHVGLISAFPQIAAPRLPDPMVDDAVQIDVEGASGVIAGINPRSVLLAVYRYLTELGCRWVRPGADGEYIPRINRLPAVNVVETPSYRHRAVCIEGAVSLEHVRDMVNWLPKLGFNGYFIQFREAYTFFDRWYSHLGRPGAQARTLSKEQARDYTAGIEHEITKRGLLYHKVGHGWTCEPFGISGLDWEKESGEPSPEITKYLAEVNGVRRLWGGVALNTNLCYSNPEVRRLVADAIATYAEEHPEIDYLHVWLADGSNNNCECEGCRRARPADFYVKMLNEADQALTQRGLNTRIVFLIYVDLLWPPTVERLQNPARFVLMFAPIARTYSGTFRTGRDLPELPPYERNKLKFPKDVAANVAFLRAWQKQFDADSFDFDYHLMWDHTNDPGHIQIAKTIGEDMKALRDIGLNGFVSCQIQRIFFPTGLAMTVMGRALWNSGLEFEEIARDYFANAFGPDGETCRAYLTELSELFDPVFMRGEQKEGGERAAARLAQVPRVIAEFIPTIERNLSAPESCWARSWLYLKHHGELFAELAQALAAKARGEDAQASKSWEKVTRMAWEKEPELHPVFDTWLFTGRLKGRFA